MCDCKNPQWHNTHTFVAGGLEVLWLKFEHYSNYLSARTYLLNDGGGVGGGFLTHKFYAQISLNEDPVLVIQKLS